MRLQNLDDSGVTAIAPFMQRSGLIAAKGEVYGVSINGVDTDSYAQVSSIFRYSAKGHLLGDNRFNVIIGSRIARTLGVGIGDPVTLLLPESKVDLAGSAFRQKKFYVSDIFDSRTLQDATHVYISLSDAGALFRQREPVMRGSRICLTQAHCGRTFQPSWVTVSIRLPTGFQRTVIYSERSQFKK